MTLPLANHNFPMAVLVMATDGSTDYTNGETM
jgi:hypothetical protein